MRLLLGLVQGVLWVSDGFHDLRATYHPIQDIKTYLAHRKAH